MRLKILNLQYRLLLAVWEAWHCRLPKHGLRDFKRATQPHHLCCGGSRICWQTSLCMRMEEKLRAMEWRLEREKEHEAWLKGK